MPGAGLLSHSIAEAHHRRRRGNGRCRQSQPGLARRGVRRLVDIGRRVLAGDRFFEIVQGLHEGAAGLRQPSGRDNEQQRDEDHREWIGMSRCVIIDMCRG